MKCNDTRMRVKGFYSQNFNKGMRFKRDHVRHQTRTSSLNK